MNKQLKSIILIFITVLLVTGCSGQYSIDITNDSVKENFNISEDKNIVFKAAYKDEIGSLDNYVVSYDYLDKYTKKYEKKYVNDYYSPSDNFYNYNKTTYNIGEFNYSYRITGNNRELNQYKSSLVNTIIKDSLIVNDNNIIIHNDRLPEYVINNFDEFKIIVNTSLNVSSNNADSVEDNQYVWNFNKDNYYNKAISIYIERTKDEDKNQLDNQKNNNNNTKQKNPIIGLLTVIAIYVVVVVFIIKSAKKKKI